MNRYDDPYDRLATLMWLLRPVDVARLVTIADLLAERRLRAFESCAREEDVYVRPSDTTGRDSP